MSEEIVRIKVLREGRHRTTVSFDKLLVEYALETLGVDLIGFGKWLQECLGRLESEWHEKLGEASIGEKVHLDAGLSRLLQRETLKMVIEMHGKPRPTAPGRAAPFQPEATRLGGEG